MNFFKSVGFFSLGLCLLSGCGALDTMDEMNSKTSKMATTTDEVSQKTDDVFDATLNMYIDLRQGNSWEVRNQAWNNVNSFKEMPAKIAEAGAYFEAMEIQLWKDIFADDLTKLDELEVAAADQFLRKIQEYTLQLNKEWGQKRFDISPFSKDNRMKNIYAFSTAMHLSNPNQERIFAKRGLKKLSIYSMLRDSIENKDEFNQYGKEHFPAYMSSVLLYEEVALYLIKVRSNFLALMAFGKLSDLDDKNDFVANFDALGKMLFGWKVDLSRKNLAQILTYTRWIREAEQTCQWIKTQTGECRVESKLRTLFKKMKIEIPKAASESFSHSLKELAKSINDYINVSKNN